MKSMKSTSYCHYGNMDDSLITECVMSHSEKVNGLIFQWCLTFYRTFQAKDRVDPKTFLDMAVPNQYRPAITK